MFSSPEHEGKTKVSRGLTDFPQKKIFKSSLSRERNRFCKPEGKLVKLSLYLHTITTGDLMKFDRVRGSYQLV